MHAKLLEQVLRTVDTEIDALLLCPAPERNVNDLIKKLKKLGKMTRKIQRADATLCVARAYLVTVSENYPALSNRSDPDASIVLNLLFESGFSKIQDVYEEDLTSGEREKNVSLLLRKRITMEVDSGGTSIAERAAKHLESNRGGGNESLFSNTSILLPTPSMCERCFLLQATF